MIEMLQKEKGIALMMNTYFCTTYSTDEIFIDNQFTSRKWNRISPQLQLCTNDQHLHPGKAATNYTFLEPP